MALAVGAELPRKHVTAREFVLEGIRDAMLGGKLVAGQELDDHALAETFGVSRTPVREALKVLEVQGFVTHRAFSKPVVAAISPARIEEVAFMRIALEGAAVVRACLTIDEPELNYLERCTEAGLKSLQKKDSAAWGNWNRAFHTRLAAAAGMPLLSREIDSLIDLARFYSSMLWREIPHSFREAQSAHLEIVKACRERNPELARKLLEDHLVASCAVQVELVNRGGVLQNAGPAESATKAQRSPRRTAGTSRR